ncbi:MAG: hypothetical protein RL514_276 [Verrucomicrobiota bacterium]|jgi:hypothetical protein
MNLIQRLFLKLSPDPLAPLRKIEAENGKDIAWLESLSEQQAEARRAEHAARNEAEHNPNDETFRRSVELTATLPLRLLAIGSNSARAAHTIRGRIVARTLEPLKAALPIVKERLEKELAEIVEAEAVIAARVGVETQRESPAVARLNEELRRCDAFKNLLNEVRPGGEDFDRVRKVLKFALGTA